MDKVFALIAFLNPYLVPIPKRDVRLCTHRFCESFKVYSSMIVMSRMYKYFIYICNYRYVFPNLLEYIQLNKQLAKQLGLSKLPINRNTVAANF